MLIKLTSKSLHKTDKLPPNVLTRREKDKKGSSTAVSVRRLDIRINLPSANSGTIRGDELCDGRSQETSTSTQRDGKDKGHSTGHPPQIWERGKDSEERLRTKTWPSLHYRLWLDASNLPRQFLCVDERANRPTDYHKGRRNTSSATSNGKNLSTRCLSVSKPPSRQYLSSCDARMRSGSSDLQVDNSWQVSSSYAHRETKDQRASVRSYIRTDSSQAPMPRPRLPSRMGANNFELFLKQTSAGVSHSHSTSERTPIPPSRLSAVISPRYHCNTSAEVNLLTLRSFARNPRLLQELAEENRDRGESDECFSTVCGKGCTVYSGRTSEEGCSDQTGVKHVRFSIPCGGEEGVAEGGARRRSVRRKINSGEKRELESTDVTPPPTPPTFDQAYRIRRYIIIPTHSSE